MCYRISIPGPEALERRFNAQYLGEPFNRQYHTSAFDTPNLPVIADENPRQIMLFHWGLIPFWVKDTKTANELRLKTANARAESIYEKPAFRTSAQNKHCLVLADGFFEWREINGLKYPYYIQLQNRDPFAFAGLWDSWQDPITNKTIQTCTIITTAANTLLAIIHNQKKRMPVILEKNSEQLWITPGLEKDQAESLLKPYTDKEMHAYTISKLITARGKNPNISEVIQPFQYPGVEPFFGKQ
jgi:putative SOS response-associated peptidase YedK